MPLAVYESLDKADRMRLLVDELKRQPEARYKPGVAGFEELLGVIDLAGEVDAGVKKVLIEMREVRNVLVHNAGVIDRRLTDRCPWRRSWKVGRKVVVKHENYREYRQGLTDYVFVVTNRVRVAVGLPTIDWKRVLEGANSETQSAQQPTHSQDGGR